MENLSAVKQIAKIGDIFSWNTDLRGADGLSFSTNITVVMMGTKGKLKYLVTEQRCDHCFYLLFSVHRKPSFESYYQMQNSKAIKT